MTWRNRGTAAALAAALVVGCGAPTPPASRAPDAGSTSTAARGIEAASSTIPWSRVGPGWLLATWSPALGRGSGEPPPGPAVGSVPTTLYLVDPVGGRYPIASFPPSGEGPGLTLADWSGDGSHALLYSWAPGSPTMTITTVDLHTGRQTSLTVDGDVSVVPHYTRPQGKAVILAKWGSTVAASLRRIDLAGKPELTYPVGKDFQGSYLSTPDGTKLVLGTATGLALMGNDGTAGKALPIAGEQDCAPTRWWDAPSLVAVARCSDAGLTRLWLVPVTGRPPTALTARLTGQGPDYGDFDAWQLPSGVFVQFAGGCGSEYLGKLDAIGGTTTRVDVPDVDPRSSTHIVGLNGSHLVVQGRVSCGGGQGLLDYDPGANASTVLLGPPLNGGGVIAAVPYPDRP